MIVLAFTFAAVVVADVIGAVLGHYFGDDE